MRLRSLFTGEGKAVARQPRPSNLLGSLESADIWPAAACRGDRERNPPLQQGLTQGLQRLAQKLKGRFDSLEIYRSPENSA